MQASSHIFSMSKSNILGTSVYILPRREHSFGAFQYILFLSLSTSSSSPKHNFPRGLEPCRQIQDVTRPDVTRSLRPVLLSCCTGWERSLLSMAKARGQVMWFLQILCPLSSEKLLPLPWGLEAFQSYVACILSGQGTIVSVEIEGVSHPGFGLE